MSPRQSSSPLPNQPVRLYKFVALSFLFLTIVLLGVIVFMSSKRTTITVITKDDPVEAKTTFTVAPEGIQATIPGKITTVDVSLTKEFSPTATKEELAVATGMVILHNESSVPQPLVATTRLLAPNQVLYRLKNQVTVPANGTIEAEVYADEKGAAGNIGPVNRFTIPGLNEEKQKVIYGTSDTPLSGGIRLVGILGETDVQKAEKQLELLMKEEGEAKLRAEHLEPEWGAVFSVVSQTVSSTVPIGEEVDAFALNGVAQVVGVFYPKADVAMLMEKEFLKRLVGDNEMFRSAEGDFSLLLTNYDSEKRTATLDASQTGRISLNPESPQLAKTLFFGKNRDDVRRYLLSLDHVYSVEVEFSPLWVRTIPFVPEHVNILVKKVMNGTTN